MALLIETLPQSLGGFPEPARLPEIYVARQFANDDQIDRPRDFRTQGGRIGKLGEKLCRPQVREQPQLFAEPQDRLLGPQMPFQPVAIRIAHSAEQRSEEHTSEPQSLMRLSYAVFCLKQQIHKQT